MQTHALCDFLCWIDYHSLLQIFRCGTTLFRPSSFKTLRVDLCGVDKWKRICGSRAPSAVISIDDPNVTHCLNFILKELKVFNLHLDGGKRQNWRSFQLNGLQHLTISHVDWTVVRDLVKKNPQLKSLTTLLISRVSGLNDCVETSCCKWEHVVSQQNAVLEPGIVIKGLAHFSLSLRHIPRDKGTRNYTFYTWFGEQISECSEFTLEDKLASQQEGDKFDWFGACLVDIALGKEKVKKINIISHRVGWNGIPKTHTEIIQFLPRSVQSEVREITWKKPLNSTWKTDAKQNTFPF